MIDDANKRHILPFDPELIPLIRSGAKRKTYRFGDKYGFLNVGDEVAIQDFSSKEIIGNAVITGKSRTTFGELPLDIDGHERYQDKERQREVFSDYYKYVGRFVKDEDPFLVLEFRMTSVGFLLSQE